MTEADKAQLTKKRIEIQNVENASTDPTQALNIIKELLGTVSISDKVKGYYHTVIVLGAAILVLLNHITPIFDWLPSNIHGYIDVIIVLLGAVINFMKSNETWVDDLPSKSS